MSTISGTITHNVVYGVGAQYNNTGSRYASPLTITNTGFIDFAGNADAAVVGNGAGSLVNNGSIVASGFAVSGVDIVAGTGTVINNGLIQGYFEGLIMGVPGVAVNSGRIVADGESPLAGGGGVEMAAGGSFTNLASGYVNFGVLMNVNSDGVGFNATLTNAGTITDGVVLNSNFYYNVSTGQLVVEHIGTGTLFDSGTIDGGPNSGQIAIYMGGSSALLVLQSGYALHGPAIAGGTDPHTLELMSSPGSPVTVNFNPTSFQGFGTVGFYPGVGNAGTLAFALAADEPGTITGFTAPHDVIDLKFISDTADDATATLNSTTDRLTVTGDNGSTVLQLDTADDYAGLSFQAVPDAAGTGTDVLPIVCFCAGTQIMTEHGEVPIETLAVGDRVRLWDGGCEPVVWIGQGRVLATRGRRSAATPVVICKGALADNVPNRDLRVTKAHSLLLDGVLIPVEFLVNHRSVRWDDQAGEVPIYHIELATHGVLVANGAPAESYRDDGNRWLFQNAASSWARPPQPACAPVLTGGAVVDAIWSRLLARSGPRRGLPLTADPALHLLADGRRLDGQRQRDGRFVFRLPGVPRSLRIGSRTAVPQELGLGRDPRELGVALRRIVVSQGPRCRVIEAADSALAEGFHAYEPDNAHRWTRGDALLPGAIFDGFRGAVEVALTITGSTRYLDEGERLQVA